MKKQILIITIILFFSQSQLYSNKFQNKLKTISVFGVLVPFLYTIKKPANTIAIKKNTIKSSKQKKSTTTEMERVRLYSTLN